MTWSADGVDLFRQKPIPPLKEPAVWSSVPILDCGEAMVALNEFAPGRIRVEAQYYRQHIPAALPTLYLRRGVAEKLLQAAGNLPAGYSLVIWDAWRPISVQQILYDRYVRQISSEHAELSGAEVLGLAAQKVSKPAAASDRPSPHSTGGAVDLTIADARGEYLTMGTGFDDFGPRSSTRFFEELLAHDGVLSSEDQESLRNRRLLFHVLAGAGFTNYFTEWWHFDYGNQFWGAVVGRPAIYGFVSSDHTVSD